ncbi:MAG: hypothetical protein EOP38_13030 [Rubrivivax sp.]|nr:MAG: hypothetical protein EOP38_13030 [Rubrivivax sp.]
MNAALPHRLMRAGALLALAWLAGCATVNVRRVTNATPEAAYELEGTSLPQLEVEAQRLCPHGYDPRRLYQNYQRLSNDEVFYVRWWNKVSDTVSTPTHAKAQLAVVCKPAPKAAPPASPAASASAAP